MNNTAEWGFHCAKEDDRSPGHHIQYLEKRVEYLEEVNRYTLDALEMAASLGDFQHSINQLEDLSSILKETRSRIERLIRLQIAAFYLVDEDTNDFFIAEINPSHRSSTIREEVDFLVDNGTFAWALMEKRPVIITSKNRKTQMILHSMSTSSRIRGMFVGLLENGVTDIPDISLSLLSIIILNSSNALESFELYKMIRESEERFRLINENALDIIFTADIDGTINFVNPAWERLLGHTPADVIGKSFLDFVPPEEKRRFNHQFENAADQPQTFSDINLQLIAKDGSAGHFSISSFPNTDDEGGIIGRVGVLRDISERFRAECELADARTVAEAASRAKSEFLANMSHEIRTPLNGVIATLNLFEETDLTAEQQYHLEMASVSAESLLGIINDILDFSKIEAGKLELEETPFNLEKELYRLMNVFSVKAGNKRVELIVGYGSDAPRYVIGDSNRLRQVLYNLVGNALKFTQEGHIWINVEHLQPGTDKATFKISVEDTGIGICEDKLDHIFDHFAQADTSTTRKYGGTGLGLAICHQLIDLMGGRIKVTSTPGKGTTFTVWLDLHVDKQRGNKVLDTAALSNCRVLMVDDNKINRRIFSEYLKRWNVKHEVLPSAADALRVLREAHLNGDPYTIVVTDYSMPDMDGVELCGAVKSDPDLKNTIMMIMSTLDRDDNINGFERAGFSAYLTKPLNMSDFLNSLLKVRDRNHGAMLTSCEFRSSPNNSAKPSYKLSGAGDMHILLVDDNRINQEAAVAILNKIGFNTVAIAENGEVALDMFRSSPPFDLILMDVQMPVMDGYEATSHIRKMENESERIPIIAMTANAIEGDREKCLAAGMDDYISKPIRIQKFAQVLKPWTDKIKPTRTKQLSESKDAGDPKTDISVFNFDETVSRYDGDVEVVRMIIESFIEEMPATIREIESALESECSARVKSRAHALKGGAAYIGAERVRDIAFKLEKAGECGDLAGITAFLPRLQSEFDLFYTTLKDFSWDK